jgi:hypothetical protein
VILDFYSQANCSCVMVEGMRPSGYGKYERNVNF